MKKQTILALVSVLAFTLVGAVSAQTPTGPPKPGPEHQKLTYFVGKWVSAGETKASAYGPASKYTFTQVCEWFDGNFAVVCRSEGKIGDAAFTGLSVMSYEIPEKAYIYFETNSFGENVVSHGTVSGDTWTWNGEGKGMDGKPVRARFTLKQVSADSASYKFEIGSGSEPLALVMEGKQTRQK
jgi:Protein of unknown function (DUF1579)